MSSIRERRLNDHVTLVDVENAAGRATLSLFGGQVLSFTPAHDGRERLYLSRLARLDGSKSIRGGIPVCWPWFGAHQQQTGVSAHGYARTRQWQLTDTQESATETLLVLEARNTQGTGFAGTARLQLAVSIGAALQLVLTTTNAGTTAFHLSMALHSYFAVDDIRTTRLSGLGGRYSDKTRDWAHFDTPRPYGFTEETDRIHMDAAARVDIMMANGARTQVASEGHDSIVVWNPWSACARNFPDMEAQDYTRMLCVETALTQGYELAPGKTHGLAQSIS